MTRSILVVEDVADNRHILRDMPTAAGYAMTEAEDGETSVAMAARTLPDLIIMDVRLPAMDGYEAMRRIRANGETRHIPIIAVTSHALSGDDLEASEAGRSAYVSKPFSPRELLALVRDPPRQGSPPG